MRQSIHLLVRYHGAVDTNTSNGSPSTFLSLDNDANPATGFNIYGLGQIGAEVIWQIDYPFAQAAGNFNIGATFTSGAAGIAPYSTNTTWQEYRIRRDATYSTGGPSSAVFPNNLIRLALWSDGGAAEFAGGFNYQFAQNPGTTDYAKWQHASFTAPELSDGLVSGDSADPDQDGIVNLMEFALGGLPKTADPSILPDPGMTTVGADRFLTFTYKRRVAPSAVTAKPETSADLLVWDDNAARFSTVSTNTLPDGLEEVVVRLADPVTTSPAFVRLKVTLNP